MPRSSRLAGGDCRALLEVFHALRIDIDCGAHSAARSPPLQPCQRCLTLTTYARTRPDRSAAATPHKSHTVKPAACLTAALLGCAAALDAVHAEHLRRAFRTRGVSPCRRVTSQPASAAQRPFFARKACKTCGGGDRGEGSGCAGDAATDAAARGARMGADRSVAAHGGSSQPRRAESVRLCTGMTGAVY